MNKKADAKNAIPTPRRAEKLEERVMLTVEASNAAFFQTLDHGLDETEISQVISPHALLSNQDVPAPFFSDSELLNTLSSNDLIGPAKPAAAGLQIDQSNELFPAFSWEAIDAVAFEAVVSLKGSDPDNPTSIVKRGVLSANNDLNPFAKFETPFATGQYDFHVRAISLLGQHGEWSEPLTFEVELGGQSNSESVQIEEASVAFSQASSSHSINFSFIREQEGFETTGYIPTENGQPIGNSGVTISVGFDLGQHDQAFLDGTGWSQSLINKLSPYLGLQGAAAVNALAATPLTVTVAEAEQIADTVHEAQAQLVIADYNGASSTSFESIPEPAQTVIASVAFQYGDLPTRTPTFWSHVVVQNWTSAIAELRDFGDDFSSRRNREADYLEDGLAALNTGGPESLRLAAASDSGRSDSDAITNDARPFFVWQAATNGAGGQPVDRLQWVLTVAGGDTSVSADIVQQGVINNGSAASHQLPLSILSDAGYTFHLRTVQGNGLTSSWSTTDFVLDTTAPVAPTHPDDPIDGSTTPLYRDAFTSDATPNFEWVHAENDLHYFLELDQAGAISTAFPSFGSADYTIEIDSNRILDSNYTIVGGELPDNTYWRWRVRGIDAAGNVGVAPDPLDTRIRPGNSPSTVPGHAISTRIQRPDEVGSEHVDDIDIFLQRVIDSNGSTSEIQSNIDTWVVIHGRTDASESFFELAGELDDYSEGDQVLVLDWGDASHDNPIFAGLPEIVGMLDGAEWIPTVADWAVDTLTGTLGIAPSALRLVGHSWGSYLAYEISDLIDSRLNDEVGAIVALDPALTSTGYNASDVNYSEHSENSWAFYGNGIYGSADLSVTADESFSIDYQTSLFQIDPITGTAHASPVRVFTTLVRDQLDPVPHQLSYELFNLDRLLAGDAGPWETDALSAGLGLFGTDGFEGEFIVSNTNGVDANGQDQWGDIYEEIISFTYEDLVSSETVVIDPAAFGPLARIIDSSGNANDKSLSFSAVLDGAPGIHQFAIRNDGGEIVTLDQILLQGDYAQYELQITSLGYSYTQAGNRFIDEDGRFVDSISIGPGSSASVIVRLKTDNVGTFNASFNFVHNGAGGLLPTTVSLNGTVAEPSGGRELTLVTEGGVGASVLVFPPTSTGQPSSTEIVELVNTGEQSLTISDVLISGANAGDFELLTSVFPGTRLNPGARLPLFVRLTPSADGLRQADLVVTHNGTGSQSTVTLSNQALSAPDFGDSAPQTSVLWNVANQTLEATVREGDVVAIDLGLSDLSGSSFHVVGEWAYNTNEIGDFRTSNGGRILTEPVDQTALPGSVVYFAPRPNALASDSSAPNETSVLFRDALGTIRTLEITVIPDTFSTEGASAVPTTSRNEDGEVVPIDFRLDPDGDGQDDDNSGSFTDDFEVATMRVQQRLRYLGFLGMNGAPLAVDGDYGRNTGHAVAVFNASLGEGQTVYSGERVDGRRASLEDARRLGWVPANTLLTSLDDRINASFAPEWVELQAGPQFFYRTNGQGQITQTERWGLSYTQYFLDALEVEVGATPFENGPYQNTGTSLQPGGETQFHSGHETGTSVDINIFGANDAGTAAFFHTRTIDGVQYVARPGGASGTSDDEVLVSKPAGGWEYLAVPVDSTARATFLEDAVRKEEVQQLRSSQADVDSVHISEYLHDASHSTWGNYSSADVERILTAISRFAEEPIRDADGNAVAIVESIYFNDPLFWEVVPGGDPFDPVESDLDRVRTRTPLTAVKPLNGHAGHIHVQLVVVDPADYPPVAPIELSQSQPFLQEPQYQNTQNQSELAQQVLETVNIGSFTIDATERLLSATERTELSDGLQNLVPTVTNAFMEAVPINTLLAFLSYQDGNIDDPVQLGDLLSGVQDTLSETLFNDISEYLLSGESVTAEGVLRVIQSAESLGDDFQTDGSGQSELVDDRYGFALFASPDVTVTGDRITFSSDFESSIINEYAWELGEDAELFGLDVDANVAASLTTSFGLSLEYGLDLAGSTPEFFVQFIDPAVAAVRAEVDGADLQLKIGAFGLGVKDGHAEFNAQMAVDFGDTIFRSDQIAVTNLGALSVDLSGGLEMVLPLSLTLGEWSLLSLPVVTISVPSIFDDPDIIFTITDGAELEPFAGITNEGLLQVINQTAGWLASLSNRIFDVDLLLVGNDLLSDYAQLGAVLNHYVLPEIQDDNGDPTFGTIQELAEIVESKVAGLTIGYDETRNTVTFDLSAEDRTTLFETELDVNVDLGGIVGFETDTDIALTAGYDLDLGLALELRQSQAAIIGDRELPSNGRLSNTASFLIDGNNVDMLTVVVPRDSSNTSREDLIDDINAALVTAGAAGVVASLTGDNRLQLTAPLTYSVAFLTVNDISNSNSARTQLGLFNGQYDMEDAIDRTWVDYASAGADITFAADPIEASAKFGFAEIEVVDGIAEATISASAEILNPDTGIAEPVRLSTLIDALVESRTSEVATFDFGGSAILDLSNIRTVGTELPVPGIPGVKFEWADIFQPDEYVATYNSDFDPLLAARFVALENVLVLLTDVRDWLRDIESSDTLSDPLPVVDKSVNDMFRLSETVDDLINRLIEVGPESMQEIERVIRDFVQEATGAILDFDPIQLLAQDYKFDFSWLEQINKQGNVVLQTDLSSLGILGAGVDAQVDIIGEVGFDATFGLDLTNPSSPVAYIEDDAVVYAELYVDADNVDADLSLGSLLGFFIVDGSVDLNNGFDVNGNPLPARVAVSLDNDPIDGRYNLIEAVGELSFSSVGSAEIILPVNFPTPNSPVNGNVDDGGSNNLIFRVGDLGDPINTTTLSGPPLDAFLDNVDFEFDLETLTGSWEDLLWLLEQALDRALFGIDLPLVGDGLRDSINFIRSVRESGGAELGNLTVFTLATVRPALYAALGPDGADVILDREDDLDDIVTIDDFEYTLVDDNSDGKTDNVVFDVSLGQIASLIDFETDFDLGLDGLGLEAEGKVQVDAGWQFNLTFGVSKEHGVYIDTNKDSTSPEIAVGLLADMPGFAVTGKLGFLQAEIRDDDEDPSSFIAGMTVDLKDLNNDGRLTPQ